MTVSSAAHQVLSAKRVQSYVVFTVDRHQVFHKENKNKWIREHTHLYVHTHTHTHIYIYIYVYILYEKKQSFKNEEFGSYLLIFVLLLIV